MFNTLSMTGTGLIGLAIAYALHFFGLTASLDSISGIVTAAITFGSALLSFIGQVRRPELVGGIARKYPR